MAKKRSKKARIGFDELNDKLDRVIDAMATHDDLCALEKRLELKIDEKFNQVMTSVDKLAKTVNDLLVEYCTVKVQLARYEERLRLVEEKLGIKG